MKYFSLGLRPAAQSGMINNNQFIAAVLGLKNLWTFPSPEQEPPAPSEFSEVFLGFVILSVKYRKVMVKHLQSYHPPAKNYRLQFYLEV